ncbi:hypothetical protein ACFYRG_33495 [Streptomyces mirabilis]|uniref:hypothetical protein n=1 Tax=Streptomyces mirabilis TaxID=68239 RepID=UPI00368C1AFB
MTVLAPDHQRIPDMLEERRSGQASGGWLFLEASGKFSAGRRPAARGRAGRRLILVAIDHRITTPLLVGNVS